MKEQLYVVKYVGPHGTIRYDPGAPHPDVSELEDAGRFDKLSFDEADHLGNFYCNNRWRMEILKEPL